MDSSVDKVSANSDSGRDEVSLAISTLATSADEGHITKVIFDHAHMLEYYDSDSIFLSLLERFENDFCVTGVSTTSNKPLPDPSHLPKCPPPPSPSNSGFAIISSQAVFKKTLKKENYFPALVDGGSNVNIATDKLFLFDVTVYNGATQVADHSIELNDQNRKVGKWLLCLPPSPVMYCAYHYHLYGKNLYCTISPASMKADSEFKRFNSEPFENAKIVDHIGNAYVLPVLVVNNLNFIEIELVKLTGICLNQTSYLPLLLVHLYLQMQHTYPDVVAKTLKSGKIKDVPTVLLSFTYACGIYKKMKATHKN